MEVVGKVRERVRKFFNPESFDARACRDMMMSGLMSLLMTEVLVYLLLKRSAELGELPHNITDALIIGISSLEVVLNPLLCWLGTKRRRSVMMGWILLALLTTLPLFFLPNTETTPDAGLCLSIAPRSLPTGISTKAAVRLSLLVISGLTSALARAAITGHGLAYLDEHTPSANLHMNVGVFVLHRVMAYLVGSFMISMFLEKVWIQLLICTIQYLITLLRLYTYPEVAPGVEKIRRSEGGLFRSFSRVLSSALVIVLILTMALLTAAWWGFGIHEAAFVQVKYNMRPDIDSDSGWFTVALRLSPIILGVILAGYMYTAPVMPKYDSKAALGNVARSCIRVSLVFVLLTAMLNCRHGGVEGADDTYSQPACGQSCGCDRPWMEYTPVCVPEHMTTYFSPCHAGCAAAEIVNNVSVYSNCTCAPGGRVTIGACTDGSCVGPYAFHQMLLMVVAAASTTALVWMITTVLETVDKRDVAVAVGIISSVISLFAFVGAHGFYLGISSSTCAYNHGSNCLLQSSRFVPWVGYSSAVLAGLAFILSLIACIVLRRQKEPKQEIPDVEPS